MFETTRPHENKDSKMILWLLILPLTILVPTAGKISAPSHHAIAAGKSARLVVAYGKLPFTFETNHGQADSHVKFLSRGPGYTLFLTSNEAVLTLGRVSREEPDSRTPKSLVSNGRSAQQERPSVLRLKLLGGSSGSEVIGEDQLPGKSNYFIGNDPSKWHTDVPQYGKVRYAGIYPGVDLLYYGNQRELEYDFVIRPGADPNRIRLGIAGAEQLRLEHGDLVITNKEGDVRLRRPHIYQEFNKSRRTIWGEYIVKGENEVRIQLGRYDRKRALVIDPVLAYSTYLGGGGDDIGSVIAVDGSGNSYVAGHTWSTDFPITNAIQPAMAGDRDAFVTKINADGTALIYSTFLGGSGDDRDFGIAVDAAENVYVTGGTNSTDFPTVRPIQPSNHGDYDLFVSKINAEGNALVYSTYLGGGSLDRSWGLAIDSFGSVYLTGETRSSDFPTVSAIQTAIHGPGNAFVSKINPEGSAIVYSTYVGGSRWDSGLGIAVDRLNGVYIAGSTTSPDFPTIDAIQPTYRSNTDAFLTKIDAGGSSLIYSTYIGGSGVDEANAVAVDSAGNVYVTGQTNSSDFPTANPIQPIRGGKWDAFVLKITSDGKAMVYSSYLGGLLNDMAFAIAVDDSGNAYVGGATDSYDFPRVNAIKGRHATTDAFATKIASDGSTFAFSTLLGGGLYDYAYGIALDGRGNMYLSGTTISSNFPTTPLAFQRFLKGSYDALVVKIASETFVNVYPGKLAFATQLVGTTSPPFKKFTMLTNNGSSALPIRQVYIAGANPTEFAETNDCPTTLAADATCSIWITFTPAAKDMRQALLAISDSDSASPQAIPLSGTGTVVSLSPKSLGFGKKLVGSTTSAKTVILTNLGSTPLNFTGINITGTDAPDYSQSNTCGTSVAAGANCGITVTFKPTALGIRRAAVAISDDGGGSPQKIALAGTGI